MVSIMDPQKTQRFMDVLGSDVAPDVAPAPAAPAKANGKARQAPQKSSLRMWLAYGSVEGCWSEYGS